ncbi:MAG: sigma-54 dependent transcriptional regulator [Gemmatimonadaceae bacterium]
MSVATHDLSDRRTTPIRVLNRLTVSSLPKLALLAVSDSFIDAWDRLASEAGLDLVSLGVARRLGWLGRKRWAVAIVAAGGREEDPRRCVRSVSSAGIEVAAVGALPNHRLASTVVRAGAREYFALPGDLPLLRSWLAERAERPKQKERRASFAEAERAKYQFAGILGESAALKNALARAARVIPHAPVTVLISGETGTGKELVARAIHYNGPRREAPFVDVNCAALPDHLLESELFGHEKGAFTDASAAKPGLFELANGGTLFLDEIGHLPLQLQGKLLRALEERAVRRVGGTRTIQVDLRLIAASHVDLAAAVKRGEFREDLFYRLNVVPIELPPLRARREDILPLARHFLTKFAADYGVPTPTISPAAERELLSRDWAGNVRELRNLMERATLLSMDGVLETTDVTEPVKATAAGGIPFPCTIGELQRAAAREMLSLCGGNKSEAARRLGISRPRLQRLLDAMSDADVNGLDDDAAE